MAPQGNDGGVDCPPVTEPPPNVREEVAADDFVECVTGATGDELDDDFGGSTLDDSVDLEVGGITTTELVDFVSELCEELVDLVGWVVLPVEVDGIVGFVEVD